MTTSSRRRSRSRQLRDPNSRRWVNWKRAALLAPVLAGLFFVSLVERGDIAFGSTSRAMIVAALKDPLSLFADRSPGERGTGPLHMTKGGPHERVLSTVRDREPPADVADASIPEGDPAEILDALPGDGVVPSNRVFGAIPWPTSFPYPGFDWPDTYPPGKPPTNPPTEPPGEPPIVSPVPEPATWLMLLAGVLMLRFGTLAAWGQNAGRRFGGRI